MSHSYETSITLPDETTPLNKDGEIMEARSSSTSLLSKMKTSSGTMMLVGAWCGVLMIAGISPQAMNLLRTRNLQANIIKVCVKEMILVTEEISEGATVDCYDNDIDRDDEMGSGLTDSDGCTTINYAQKWWDWNGSSPDIYCRVNKPNFVESVPPPINNVNQDNTVHFAATIYRDRVNLDDFGVANLCSPEYSERYGDVFATAILGFDEQCNNHDKCYYDCQIFEALGEDATEGQKFCDYEMYQGMKSFCYLNHDDFIVTTDDSCLTSAHLVYFGLQAMAGNYYTNGITAGKYSCLVTSDNESKSNVYDFPSMK